MYVFVYCQPYHIDLLETYPINTTRNIKRANAKESEIAMGKGWRGESERHEKWERIVHIFMAFRISRIRVKAIKNNRTSSNKSVSNNIASLDSNLDCTWVYIWYKMS